MNFLGLEEWSYPRILVGPFFSTTMSSSEKHTVVQTDELSPDLSNVIHDIDSGEINELAVVAEGEEKTSWFVWMLVLSATVSGLLFGTCGRHQQMLLFVFMWPKVMILASFPEHWLLLGRTWAALHSRMDKRQGISSTPASSS